MEFLLINHPLDCPVCDKGGECPLQNQAMSNGRGETRFDATSSGRSPSRSTSPPQVLLDRERCVLCARCTRFSEQIAGDPFIELLERGALQQVGIYEKEPFESYFSGNTIQICPVGALTGAAYRFRARPFDLVSTPSVLRALLLRLRACGLDYRRGKVMRRLAGDDPQVNEEWNCDKGRWAFNYADAPDRITQPLVRDEDGELRAGVVARGAATSRPTGWPRPRWHAGVLAGGRLTLEDAYAYAKFARVALGTNDVDFRARAHSDEEADFLAAARGGHRPRGDLRRPRERAGRAAGGLRAGGGVADRLPAAAQGGPQAGAAGLRRRAVRQRGLRSCPAPSSRPCPATRPRCSTRWPTRAPVGPGRGCRARSAPGAVILVGERLAGVPGALSAALRLAPATGARLAWIPRRAGERGAHRGRLRCRACSRGAARRPMRRRARSSRRWGARAPGAGRDTAASSPAARCAQRAGRRRRRGRRPARPGRRAGRARRRAVRGQPRDLQVRR